MNITLNGQELKPTQTKTYKDGVLVNTVNHDNAGAVIDLEKHILQAFEIQEVIKKGQEELAKLKFRIADEMKLSVMNETHVALNELFDLKVKLTERTTKKTDKEEMAKDLGVAVTAINTKFLLKAVEDKKLSFQRYLDYLYQETNEGVSIRKTKAVADKKKKN
jgi:hypothetical protein